MSNLKEAMNDPDAIKKALVESHNTMADLKPTNQSEDLRVKLDTLVHLHHYGFCENGCYKMKRDNWDELCEARARQYELKLEALIRQEVLECLERLDDESETYSDDFRSARAVPLSAITAEKTRYQVGGK